MTSIEKALAQDMEQLDDKSLFGESSEADCATPDKRDTDLCSVHTSELQDKQVRRDSFSRVCHPNMFEQGAYTRKLR
jgi:hypothetical protein